MADYILNNRYRLLAQVASGGMAVVYKAHDLTLNRVVAVKILRENFADDSGFRARFQSEAQAAANLAHPNIVTVYDYGQDGNRAYIVMEFVEGRDLKSVIRAESPLPMDRAIDLMAQACAALGHAHRAGLVHCDVKPQNLIVTPDGRLKVTDFGIARAISQSLPQNVETVWGTPHYFSPEQAAGETPTPASDAYSLGVVMYEMLSGRLPFDADNHTDLAMQHLQDEPPPLTAINPAVPIQIEQIINRVMAKDPAARYRTADQFGRALMDYRRMADQMTGLQNAVPINVGSNSTTVGAAARPIAPAAPAGTDWLGWILGALAAIAVIGLIPLLFLVLRAYSAPPPVEAGALTPSPNPTAVGEATLPPFAEQVLIPKFVGLTQKDAEQLAGTTGLQLVIGPGRFDAQIPSGAVAAQNPLPGRRVPRNSPVEINLSQGPQISPMINVLNFTYEEVAAGLTPYGWDIRLVEEYSQEPYHKILKQEPPAGLPLAASQPLTLTVSGGTTVTLGVNLSDQITLDAANLPLDQIKRGMAIDLTLFWRGQRRLATPYTVFVHLIDPNGQLRQQIDTEPGAGTAPTPSWTPGITVTDRYAMDVPANLPPGVYQLRAGLYPTGQPLNRLAVTDPGKASVDSDSILIRQITVLP
ncbi:MAG: protein kinase [Chloroflexi bacterium]|nr:protein kinase [Chloroflexota bacterium]